MRRIIYNILATALSVAVVLGLPSRGWGQNLPFRGQGAGQARTQEEAVAKAKQAIRRMAAVYRQTQFLSFDVLYRYAAEAKPDVYLDSLKGQYKLNGNRFWSMLDSRESLCDASLLMVRFEEDNIMYLTKPAAASLPGQGGAGLNDEWSMMLDTLLFNNKEMKYDYAETNSEQLITISFSGQAPSRTITWHIDRATGYLTKMSSLVRSEQLYDPSARPLITGAASSYVIVETLYTNYSQGGFNDSVFDLGKYIKKEGQEYVTVAPYEKYKVFIGTPGL